MCLKQPCRGTRNMLLLKHFQKKSRGGRSVLFPIVSSKLMGVKQDNSTPSSFAISRLIPPRSTLCGYSIPPLTPHVYLSSFKTIFFDIVWSIMNSVKC